MNFTTKRRLQILKQYSIGWTLAFIFLSIVRGEGTQEEGSVELEVWKAIAVSVCIGPLFGSLSGLVQMLTEERGYKRISLHKLVILRGLFALLFVISIVLLAYVVFGGNIELFQFAFEPGSLAIYFYIICVDMFMFSLRQVNLFLGKDKLWKLLKGSFYVPREEERIFMFLDLKDSTTHAEKLGHIQYSKMIQDCFNDLGVVVENEAEIYQYVGDEVILTWKMKEGFRHQNCVRAYMTFQKQLAQKKDYYLNQYGVLPHFKAGVHAGNVTVTEVGKYKKEIAYHGDAINTAARIQGKCNELNRSLLISESIKKGVVDSAFTVENLNEFQLKGKKSPVRIYAVIMEKN